MEVLTYISCMYGLCKGKPTPIFLGDYPRTTYPAPEIRPYDQGLLSASISRPKALFSQTSHYGLGRWSIKPCNPILGMGLRPSILLYKGSGFLGKRFSWRGIFFKFRSTNLMRSQSTGQGGLGSEIYPKINQNSFWRIKPAANLEYL